MTGIQYFWRHPLAEEGREEGRREGRREGQAQERAAMILRTLRWRQIGVPDEVRDRVLSSTDLDQLETWLDRSYQVTDAADLFAEGV
ncbi:hypothetical protein [Streptomyces cellulosae]|uniref:hypothetical protein n=1 Tax=Streptomyces cellulosae TaxID=1968 RepID=UPI0004CADFFB|nr:hypothetical protein [Streptomyces cellulosae]